MGVENPKVIDLVTITTAGDVVLVMIDDRPWDGGVVRLAQLQDKINHYLAFALDGDMFVKFPQTRGRPLSLRLDCSTEPDARTREFLVAVATQVDVPIAVNVR